ncbi:MAG TPA: O-antigen ligase family protein [Proteobacteria bacterium]|nr:O-antigen ligase family protein [Pseudomonadota bacterium]
MSCPQHELAYAPGDIGFGESKSSLVPALLWFCLLVWVVRVTVFIRQRGDFAAVDLHAGVQIAVVLFMFLVLLLSARVAPMWSRLARTSVRLLFLYYSLSAISALWSSMPSYTAYRAFEFIVSLMAVFVALSYSPNLAAAERKALFICFVVLIFSMYVNIKFYGLSFSLFDWHTNSYSASAAIMFCYCVGEYFSADKKRAKTLKRYGILSLGALIIGTSAASNIAALCGLVVLLFLYRRLGWVTVAIFLLSMMFLTGSDFSFFKDILFPGKTEQQISTLGGREQMWETFKIMIAERPFYGHGFAVLSTGRGGAFVSHPHNSLYSVLLGTGAIGALAFGSYLFRLLREGMQTARQRLPGAIGGAGALAAGLVNSLAMPLIGDQYEESSLVFCCMMALFVLFVFLPYMEKRKDSATNGHE